MNAAEIKTKEDLQLFNKIIAEKMQLVKGVTSSIDASDAVMNAAMNSHDREKIAYELLKTLEREGASKEAIAAAKRIDEALEDVGQMFFNNGKPEKMAAWKQKMLKKYGHNIPSVIKPNRMILTLEHNITSKELLGNKGANLVTLFNLGIKVPPSLFLTSVACRLISSTQSFDIYPLIRDMAIGLFKTEKVAIRSSGVVSMPGMMDTMLDIDINDQAAVTKAILDVVNSWDSPRAVQYRKICKLSNDLNMAIVIQPVIRGDKGYSGICFSRDVTTGKAQITGEFVKKALGDSLATGTVTPININSLPGMLEHGVKPAIQYVGEASIILEKNFKQVQDIEWVNDGTETYIVQARTAKLSEKAAVRVLIDFYNEGIIENYEFQSRLHPEWKKHCAEYYSSAAEAEFLCAGKGAVGGIVTGMVALNENDILKYATPILVREDTTPSDLKLIAPCIGVVTQIGGFTSHPAMVCREMNKPCVISADISNLKSGDVITVNGETGRIYSGSHKFTAKPVFEEEVNEILNTI